MQLCESNLEARSNWTPLSALNFDLSVSDKGELHGKDMIPFKNS